MFTPQTYSQIVKYQDTFPSGYGFVLGKAAEDVKKLAKAEMTPLTWDDLQPFPSAFIRVCWEH